MCGIAGIWNLGKPVDRKELLRATLALHHRGPDGHEVWVERDIGFGHTRLAILDLSDAGKCPMAYQSPDGRRFRITFNGEIYNFLELRAELSALGYRFSSDTDTEVILAAYAEWGDSCLFRFNGMWAFAIWDEHKQQLFLARDRFAVKPLYFYISNRFVFASELKSFLELDDFTPATETEIIPALLQHSYSVEGTTDLTLLKNVRRLLGGHSLTVKNDGQIAVQRWWNTADHLSDVPKSYDQQVEKFRELFFDAVRIRMRSDVPVSTCLSGGIDSSAICSTMTALHRQQTDLSRCAQDWQKSFIATFPGTMIDERKHAEEVVRHTKVKPHYWVFNEQDAISHIVDSVWSLEDVYGGIAVPVWCLYRELRRNKVVVSIDGHGGDELLGGYPWFLDQPLCDLNAKLFDEFHFTTLPSILRNFDKMSAAHGIEVRSPFLDYRLVTYSFSLPPESKVGSGFTKQVLRDALKSVMPESIRTRRQKIGFNAPMIEWYNGALLPLMERVMQSEAWLESPHFDASRIAQYALRKSRGKAWKQSDWDDSLKIWTLMNFTIWQMLFVEQQKKASFWESRV